eukprot:c28088_g2_i1 orf=285-1868(-)
MGKPRTSWLNTLILGKKSSKPPIDENQPQTERKSKLKRRWSFGKSSAQSKASDTFLDRKGMSFTMKDKVPEIPDSEQVMGVVAADAVAGSDGKFHSPSLELSPAPKEELDLSAVRKREEWAAIKLQTAFRRHMGRRRLKGVVRLQALVRGHIVRRQARTTLRCVQAVVRVQARVRARRVRMSEEGQAVQQKLRQRQQQDLHSKEPMGDRDSSNGTLHELHAKMGSVKEGVAKRERALAYAFSRQLWRSAQKEDSLVIDSERDESHWGWSWLERWMAARPWETVFLDGNEVDSECNSVTRNPENDLKVSQDDSGKLKTTKNQAKLISEPLADTLSSCSVTLAVPKLGSNISTKSSALSEFDQTVNSTSSVQHSLVPSSITAVGISAVTNTSICAMGRKESTSAVLGQETTKTVSNGGFVHTEEQLVKKDNALSRPQSRTSRTRRSFSGPLKVAYGESNNILGSVPSYMANTESSKAKVRLHSNTRPKAEEEEKLSPVLKRRTSLPMETKQSSAPMRALRSSSAKGLTC